MILTNEEIMDVNQNHEFDSAIGFARAIEAAVIAKIKAGGLIGWWHQGATEEESDFHLAESRAGEDCPTCIPLYRIED